MAAVYQFVTLVLQAGAILEQGIYGSYLRILSCDITTNPQIRIGSGTMQEIQPGMGIKLDVGQTFGKVVFYNPSATEVMTVKYAVGDGYIDDSSLTLSGSTVFDSILAELQGGTTPQNWGLVTVNNAATQIAAANTARKSISVTNLPTNTGVIYLGFDNSVTALKYFQVLNPGDSWSADDTRASVYGLAAVNGEKVALSEV